ncbi:diguanylate cyclase [Halomonas campisalis]|uniref:diguanylate cyclase n=1 Tax=Billgrantia campisalis TaxID=74661 RepID=A0ABS9P475_9GAMM|nr:diguanylate cyclase [Halomonas campisalis]MCG6656596.1 diguanylate cyclase [Halomonas campisalis]MDR5861783.1 diguanylate cyclase [Halomonas campisalis]
MPDTVSPDASRLLAALASGSRELIDAYFWSKGVDALLGELGRASGVSRVWIFQLIELQPDAVVQDYVFEWAAAPRYRQLMQKRFRFFSMIFDDPVYRRMVEERQRGEAQHFITQSIPPGPLRDNLASQGIHSMVTVPIMVEGRWWGTLGFDDCERALDWQGSGMHALKVAAELIASALYRQRLTSRRRQLELFQQVTDCGIWEIDPHSASTWCSRALLRSLGYPDRYAHLPLRRLLAHIVAEDRRRLWKQLRESLSARLSSWRLDVRLIGADGQRRWHEIVAEAVYDDQQRLRSLAGLVIDISQRKRGEEIAQEAAEYDELTGVMNRRGLSRHLAETLSSGCSPHHLMLVDIDHFKPVNDRYGHPAGDALLRQLASRLGNELRPTDGLARLGGEEFVVVTCGLSRPQVLALAERLRARIADAPFQLGGGQGGQASPLKVPITISVGIAELPTDQELRHGQAMAIARADQALYAAKHAGRNRVHADWSQAS